jgi:cold shock CspA family protein
MKEQGKLSVWFVDRNFGFIHLKDADGKIVSHFLHLANVVSGRENLKTGAVVSFQRVETKKGWLAVDAEVGA